MTVKELKEILEKVDETKPVVMTYSTYGVNYEINGFYFSQKEDDDSVHLTDLNVQPRV